MWDACTCLMRPINRAGARSNPRTPTCHHYQFPIPHHEELVYENSHWRVFHAYCLCSDEIVHNMGCLSFSLVFGFAHSILARNIVFPALIPQVPLNQFNHDPISAWTEIPASVAGLTTFANLPHVFCLSDAPNREVEAFDIAFLGAPFDTVTRSNRHQNAAQIQLADPSIGDHGQTWRSFRAWRNKTRIKKNCTWRVQHIHR